jgi:hypothetical protein
MHSITMLSSNNGYATYQVEQRFDDEQSFFKALYKIAQVHNYVNHNLLDTVTFLSDVGYVITLPNH